jgi:hypothetical protein
VSSASDVPTFPIIGVLMKMTTNQSKPTNQPIQVSTSATPLSQLLPVGIAVLAVSGFVLMEVLRGVDSVENVALGLFALVAIASYWGIGWSVGVAVLATVVYAILRRNALDLAGSETVNRYILGRGVGFVLFGALMGVVVSALRNSMSATKTVLRETRSEAGDVLDREVQRAKRHHRPLSVITIDLTAADQPIDVSNALRSSDYLLSGRGISEGALTIILPETDAEGADHVARRLGSQAQPRIISLDPTDPDLDSASEELELIRQRAAASTLL